MKIALTSVICILSTLVGFAQIKSLDKNEQMVYATALKTLNGSRLVYPRSLYIDSGLVAFITAFLSENDTRNKRAQFIKENNWDFIYQKMKNPSLRKATKFSSKELLESIDLHPIFADVEGGGVFSPILMNDEKTKAFLIQNVIHQGSYTLFFELKEQHWVLVKQDIWLD